MIVANLRKNSEFNRELFFFKLNGTSLKNFVYSIDRSSFAPPVSLCVDSVLSTDWQCMRTTDIVSVRCTKKNTVKEKTTTATTNSTESRTMMCSCACMGYCGRWLKAMLLLLLLMRSLHTVPMWWCFCFDCYCLHSVLAETLVPVCPYSVASVALRLFVVFLLILV